MSTKEHSNELDVGKTFAGKNVILIGSTGFVGKVMMSMLLYRYPTIGKVFALVRPGAGAEPEERFFTKVAASPAFDPVRETWGDGYLSFMREKVVPVAGDIGRPLANFTDKDFERFEAAGGISAIINSAGLVTFTPSLENALRINTIGAKNCVEVARRLNAGLVHVSTCFVAGRRDGAVWEDEQVVGYFPRKDDLRDDDFDADAEIADCQRLIDEIMQRANDRKHISEFRERAAVMLAEQKRDPDDEPTLRLAVARERKLWVHQQLTALGMERALHWGWTNTYTYTKSLGEQVVAAATDVPTTIVRPAVVESALHYPFPGWNEGFNTTAPLIYLVMKGQRQIMMGEKTTLDVIPVDMVAAGMVAATAAIIDGSHEPVYQLGSSDINPATSRRLTELSCLAVRRHFRELGKEGEKPIESRIRARLEGYPVLRERFEKTSAPRFKALADRALRGLDENLPRWGAPRIQALAERAHEELERVSQFTGQVTEVQELFRPFTHDFDIVFRCDNIRNLHARLSLQDRLALPWHPEQIDWRHYWLNIHFPGLKKWTFPVLDDEFGAKPRSVYTHKDLVELFDSAIKLHRHRVAMRLLPTNEDAEAVVFSYERVGDMAEQCAGGLRERGIEPGDRVMLMSENRPEWGISYFGILKAGGVCVPVDRELSLFEVENLLKASRAKFFVVSDKVAARLSESNENAREKLAARLEAKDIPSLVLSIGQIITEPSVSPAAIPQKRIGGDVASVIYTSGTTGAPKGVMLSHKNFTSMASKLSSIFNLYKHDVLLSVLPLHHTFEFAAGLLMPLLHGSQVTYLEEVGPETLGKGMQRARVTAMVGVPALWQLMHRKVAKPFSERGQLVERAFQLLVDANRRLRDKAPLHLGRVLFFPVHQALGGRLRVMISGGSALSPETMKAFRGLGFNIFEGYGMTEASPVISAQRPKEKPRIGSVGRALPGIDLKIFEPDERGVGEIVARGPNVMLGYEDDKAATDAVLKGGWLHTGDLGRIDEDGHLYVVGRKKEMILGTSGENVYPDELEEVYKDHAKIKEISVVGLPVPGGETVAALIVPEAGAEEEIREHVRQVSAKLPHPKRIRVLHFTSDALPRTATRKVKRNEVTELVARLEQKQRGGSGDAPSAAQNGGDAPAPRLEYLRGASPFAIGGEARWIRELIAQVAQKPAADVEGGMRLDALGFDSLMLTELSAALEQRGVNITDAAEVAQLETVRDVERYVHEHRGRRPLSDKAPVRLTFSDDIEVPAPIVHAGRRVLRAGQKALYERALKVKVRGASHVPPFGGYIVAANHASHLDMGLVKHALGERGDALVALAAKDYFFDDPVRRAYFENFTNLVPMERHGSLRESLRMAAQVIRDGYVLLIFPEGTRSEDGVMREFKASLGYLALHNKCGILPAYLGGTHDALPRGAAWFKKRNISAHIGPFQSYEALKAICEGAPRSESYRRVSEHVERLVRGLCPPAYAWTLGSRGTGDDSGRGTRNEYMSPVEKHL